MKEVSLEEFSNKSYIKNIEKLVNSCLIDGKLTDNGVDTLYNNPMFRMYGISYMDVSHIDFSELSRESFNKISFSTYTKFSDNESKLGRFRGKNEIVKDAIKNAGSFKIDDKNVSMAIIDNPTQFYKHKEFAEVNYSLTDYSNSDDAHFHLDGVMGSVASKNFGVGNKAKYHIYTVDWSSAESRIESYIKALKDVEFKINNGEKIPVISISNKLIEEELQETESAQYLKMLVEQLKNNKNCSCEVISSEKFYDCNFAPANCEIMDPLDIDNYKVQYGDNSSLGVITNKVLPLFGSTDEYKIEVGSGATSWAIPVVSYFYAVCRQYADLSFEDFVNISRENCKVNSNSVKIVDFQSVVENVKNKITTRENV